MNIDEATKIIWDAMQEDIYYPEALQGKLTMEEGYRTQLKILQRWQEAGETQAGWKIGLTAEPMRQSLNLDSPVFGYLLQSRRFQNTQTFQFDEIIKPALESALLIEGFYS